MNNTNIRYSQSSSKRPTTETGRSVKATPSMVSVSSNRGLNHDTLIPISSSHTSSSSTINEKVLRQEVYGKSSMESDNSTKKYSTTVVKEHSESSSHSLHSVLESVNKDVANLEHDIRYTKLFLQKQGLHNISIWSHLTDVLQKIIAEQPDNVIDYFEEYSRKVKQEKVILHDTFRDVYVPPPQLDSAKNQLSLMQKYGIKVDEEEEPVVEDEEEEVNVTKRMDLEEIAFYFRQAGVAIPEFQLFTLIIAIKKLTEEMKLVKPRFWGKIFGSKQDYFVLECELPEEEYARRIEEEEQIQTAEAERIAAEQLVAEGAEQALESENQTRKVTDSEDIERVENEMTAELANNLEKELEDDTTIEGAIRESVKPFEIKFDLDANEEIDDDLNLPPLPPPKKLLKYIIPPILQSIPKDTLKIPPEILGQGINKKVYFVCNSPELEWQELPTVTPEQINTARQIKVCFTGDLDSKIFTYPEFRGTEKHYLRAQIARISASTHISPLGFFKFGAGGEEEEEEEENAEEEEGVGEKNFTENPKFQPIPIKELIDPSLASWVHHSQYILKQGRTEWWNSKKTTAGEEEEAEEEQEEEEEEEGAETDIEKETGPPLLSPLSDDATIEGKPAWTTRKSHNYNRDMAVAVIKSNLWPGATAFAIEKKFENVYFGWGHKHLPYGYSLPVLPHPEYEYDLGPEIMEIQDPTVEVEQAWRVAHKKEPPKEEGENEGDEEEEEEEEEEDD